MSIPDEIWIQPNDTIEIPAFLRRTGQNTHLPGMELLMAELNDKAPAIVIPETHPEIKPTTHPHSLGHGFGDYQCLIRINRRAYLGVGHTPGEARRNAWDAVESRCEAMAGVCAVMRTEPIPVERVSTSRNLFGKIKYFFKPHEGHHV